jgi:hypothetical protein
MRGISNAKVAQNSLHIHSFLKNEIVANHGGETHIKCGRGTLSHIF